jgi:signal transduction histidine kinase
MGFLIEAIIHKNSNDALMPQLLDLQQSVRSVQLMFNSLLDLSKIESGNMMTTTTHVDIGALLDSVITLFREEAKSRGLKRYLAARSAHLRDGRSAAGAPVADQSDPECPALHAARGAGGDPPAR